LNTWKRLLKEDYIYIYKDDVRNNRGSIFNPALS